MNSYLNGIFLEDISRLVEQVDDKTNFVFVSSLTWNGNYLFLNDYSYFFHNFCKHSQDFYGVLKIFSKALLTKMCFAFKKGFKTCNVLIFNIFFTLRRDTKKIFPCCKQVLGHVVLIIVNEIHMAKSPFWLWILICMHTHTSMFCWSCSSLRNKNTYSYLKICQYLLNFSEEFFRKILIHQWFHFTYYSFFTNTSLSKFILCIWGMNGHFSH